MMVYLFCWGDGVVSDGVMVFSFCLDDDIFSAGVLVFFLLGWWCVFFCWSGVFSAGLVVC